MINMDTTERRTPPRRTPPRESLPRAAREKRELTRKLEQEQARKRKITLARLKQLKKDQDELADVLLGTVLSEEGRKRAEKLKNDNLMNELIKDMSKKSDITKSSTSRGDKRKQKSQLPPTFEFKGINPATFTLPSSGASVTASGGGLLESMGGINLGMPRRRSKSRRKVSRKKSRRKSRKSRRKSRKSRRKSRKSRRKASRKKSRRKSKSRRKASRKKSKRRKSRRKSRRKVYG
jgi:hypothetical protein